MRQFLPRLPRRESPCRVLMKEGRIYAGNYGSGKTELSLNTALAYASRGSTVLVDLDIVNPYFRSTEHREMLEAEGIRLISPPFANTGVDIPALSAEVNAAFEYDYAVFDAGGDPVGAAAIGSLRRQFELARPDVLFWYVVNARRPFQAHAPEAAELLRQVQQNARLRLDGLVNNTNVGRDTTPEDLLFGEKACRELTELTGVPLVLTSGTPGNLRGYERMGGTGPVMPLRIYTRPAWLDETADENSTPAE